MSRLELAFAVTFGGGVAFQGGRAHLYSTYRAAEYGKREVEVEVGPKMRRMVKIKELPVDKIVSSLSR